MAREELTRPEMDRLDYVHNAIHEMLCDLAGQDIEWDMEYIGEISDKAEELICNKLGIMTSMDFAPYIEGE